MLLERHVILRHLFWKKTFGGKVAQILWVRWSSRQTNNCVNAQNETGWQLTLTGKKLSSIVLSQNWKKIKRLNFNSKILVELHSCNRHTEYRVGFKWKLCLHSVEHSSTKQQKLFTADPRSFDTCRRSLISHLLPRTIFSTSDVACCN